MPEKSPPLGTKLINLVANQMDLVLVCPLNGDAEAPSAIHVRHQPLHLGKSETQLPPHFYVTNYPDGAVIVNAPSIHGGFGVPE